MQGNDAAVGPGRGVVQMASPGELEENQRLSCSFQRFGVSSGIREVQLHVVSYLRLAVNDPEDYFCKDSFVNFGKCYICFTYDAQHKSKP